MKTKITLSLLFIFSIFFDSYAGPIGSTINNPIDVGTLYQPFNGTYNNKPSNLYGNDFGQLSDDIYFKFVLLDTGLRNVSISLCNSDFDTYLYLLDQNGATIASNDDNGSLCTGLRSSMKRFLTPGTYYVVAEGYSSASGNININISSSFSGPLPVGATFNNPIDIGKPYDHNGYDTLSYFSELDTKGYMDDYGRPTDDIIYKFTIEKPMQAYIENCDSRYPLDSYLWLLDVNKNLIASNDDHGFVCPDSYNASMAIGVYTNLNRGGYFPNLLQPGTYYIVSEGYSTTGIIYFSLILGTKMSWFENPARIASTGKIINEVTIGPNPTADQVNIQLPSFDGNSSIKISNYEGRIVRELTTNNSENIFNVSDLIPGFYMVTITQGENTVRKKLEVIR